MSYDLRGKIVIVTGGATGIGLSYVKELLRNGVKGITIVDIDDIKGKLALSTINTEFGQNKAIFVKTDVTNPKQLEAAFKKTVETWKTIDVLINNAGIFNDAKWELEIDVNVNAVVRGTLLGIQYMRKDANGKGGVIANISSIVGLQESSAAPIYAATKHFIIGFSRSLGTSYHYNHTGVKIITMCPGHTDTMMSATASQNVLTTLAPDIGQRMIKDTAELVGQPCENVARGMITLITEAGNGSVWVSEGNEDVYEINFPDRKTLRKS